MTSNVSGVGPVDLMERIEVLFEQESKCYKTSDYLQSSNEVGNVGPVSLNSFDAIVDSSDSCSEKTSSTSTDTVSRLWRENMCEWAYQLVDHFDFPRELVSICMNYLDRCLSISNEKVHQRSFQLLQMTSLYLAIKLHHHQVISMESMLSLTQGRFTQDQMTAMERLIFDTLDWRLHPTTPSLFLKHFLAFLQPDQKACYQIFDLGSYFIELSVLDSFCLPYQPSCIAMAALLNTMQELPSCELQDASSLCDALMTGTRLKHEDVMDCRERLMEIYRPTLVKHDNVSHSISPVDVRNLSPTHESANVGVTLQQQKQATGDVAFDQPMRNSVTSDDSAEIKTTLHQKQDTKEAAFGRPIIFIKYTEAIGNETKVNLSLNCCSIANNDGQPITNSDISLKISRTCRSEYFYGSNDFGISEQRAMCLALCIHATVNNPDLQIYDTSNLNHSQVTYGLFTSNKVLTELDWKLNELGNQEEMNQAIVVSADKNTTLQHLNFVLLAIRNRNAILDEILKKASNATTKNCCHLDLDQKNIYDDGCGALCLALYETSFVTTVNLQNNQIGSNGCVAIFNALQNGMSTTRKMNLSNNEIGDDACEAMANALKESNKNQGLSLSCLSIGCNKMGKVGCIKFFESLQYNTSLTYLNVERNRIGDAGCAALFHALKSNNKSLKELNVEHNEVGTDACGAIGEALEENDSLLRLHLGHNPIQDEGCIRICNGLESNTSLQTLNLNDNEIGYDGYEELLNLVESHTNANFPIVDLSGNNGIGECDMAYLQHQIAERNFAIY